MAAMTVPRSPNGIPLLGFGTYNRIQDHEGMAAAVRIALEEEGYRHLDLAEFYANEGEIGRVLAEAYAADVVRREDLYLVSKAWNHNHRAQDVVACCDERLKLLGTDYLDLFLVHWPVAFRHETYRLQRQRSDPFYAERDDTVSLEETWRAMESLVDAGKVRAIGLSNFGTEQVEQILACARIRPICNQVECHPYMSQEPLRAFCAERGLTMVAFSCIGRPGVLAAGQPNVLEDSVVVEIAKRYAKTPSQIVLRWNVQRGVAVIPKSTSRERIRENAGLFNFELDDEAMRALGALNRDLRLTGAPWATITPTRTFMEHALYPPPA